MVQVKKLFVICHSGGNSYLESKTGKITKDVQNALRAGTEAEAETWKAFVKVPLMWRVIGINYNVYEGKAELIEV
jgi:hypothetical protein